MAEGVDRGALLDADARTENHIRLDERVTGEDGVMAEIDGVRVDQRGAGQHRLPAPALLVDLLDAGELAAVVDALDLLLRGDDEGRGEALAVGDLDRIGEIVFALCVLLAD